MSLKNVFFLFAMLALFGCAKSNKSIVRTQKLEEGVQNPTSIEELKVAIMKYQDRIKDIQLASGQIGIWYKILGTRYLDNKMYGEALKAFQKAIEFYPDNQNLYYYVGVCAGWMSKASLDYDGKGSTDAKENYQMLSEAAYKRALEIEPKYIKALYGLSVLYVYEMNKSEMAVPLLEELLSIDKNNLDAMFVAACAYHVTGSEENAVAMCDNIMSITKSADRKKQAEDLKQAILESAYGK